METCRCEGGPSSRWVGEVRVVENRQIADQTWKITLRAPEFAPLVASGQFVMLRLPRRNDPLLGRPFAIYSTDVGNETIEVVYLTVGAMTNRLTDVRPEDALELWGPLGNGWGDVKRSLGLAGNGSPSGKRLLMIAGGIGQTPFYLLAQEILAANRTNGCEIVPPPSLLFGARTESRFSCLDDFRRLEIDVRLATEDGSAGRQGFVTPLIDETIREFGSSARQTIIAACGPYPMLKSVAQVAKEREIECWTSLESPMACGLGICFSCVVEYRGDDGEFDYKRTCADGPVFDAARLRWD